MIRPLSIAISLLALLLGAFPADAGDSKTDKYVQLLSQGRKLLNARKWSEAAEIFRRARELVPTDWRGHAFQAVAHIQDAVEETEPDRRMGLLQQAGRIASDLPKRAGTRMTDPMYLYLRGVIMSAKSRDEQAYRTLSRVMKAPRPMLARYQDLQLADNAKMAFAQASLRLAGRMMTNGEFAKSLPVLQKANQGLDKLQGSRSIRALLERRLGVACEQIANYDNAIKHLKKCIELNDDRALTEELTASIALILFNLERMDEGRKILHELGRETTHPEVTAARCMMRYKLAMRAPDGRVMDDALRYIREAMKKFPERDRYFLAKLLADLALEKVQPADAANHRPLLLEMVQTLKTEADHRPECPGVYYRLRRLLQLLGDHKQELYYDRLFAAKKRDFDQKQKYDHQGRPRCR